FVIARDDDLLRGALVSGLRISCCDEPTISERDDRVAMASNVIQDIGAFSGKVVVKIARREKRALFQPLTFRHPRACAVHSPTSIGVARGLYQSFEVGG